MFGIRRGDVAYVVEAVGRTRPVLAAREIASAAPAIAIRCVLAGAAAVAVFFSRRDRRPPT